MAKIIRLTERDLTRLVKRVINEQPDQQQDRYPTDPYIKKMVKPWRKLVGFNPEKPDGVEDEVVSDQELTDISYSLNSLENEIENDPELTGPQKDYLFDRLDDLRQYIDERKM